ncbi:MAG: hypothetical protein VXY94_08540 [Planctomycetota bacterium]|nr:hypothetical protein [Planctomycetota bacterium]MEC8560109.1 hypothetical protein [Planctomycetota bacterium]MEC8734529.1 hypothetical protein [Planctomycetota bacterium]MEC8817583.1 hypothetical protein [Planctomycetota bacterium]MEC9156818.1 hypothetical protein [Planctomycetota bacterium]
MSTHSRNQPNSPSAMRFMTVLIGLMLVAIPLFPVLWMIGSGTMPIWM